MKHKLALAIAAATLSLSTAALIAAEEDDASYREGYGLVLAQRWTEAQEYFTQFQNDWPESTWVDDAAFWNCYALEQSSNQDAEHFNCYEAFVSAWPESSWVSDARSKLLVIASRFAARGNSEFIERIDFPSGPNFDLDFDFDFEDNNIAETIAEAMNEVERELERVNTVRSRIRLPQLPELPELPDQATIEDIKALYADMRRVSEERVRARSIVRSRSSSDDELLTVMAALRDNERAAEILIERLEGTTNPALRSRIVLLLEDVRGENVSNKLIELINNDESEEVRHNAVLVLLDREEEGSRDLLKDIVGDPTYPASVKAAIINNMDEWEPGQALPILASVLSTETELRLVAEAADTLADMGSPAAVEVLTDSYASHDNAEVRRIILGQISDVKTPETINFLSSIAINDGDDETAAVAIESIADREDNIAVAALDHIYASTGSQQRRLAALSGIGDSESEQAVEVLQRLLQGETNPEIVAAGARALGDTERESAVAVVLEIYRSNSDESVRRAAIRAMRRLDDHSSATDALLEILEDRLSEETVQ